MLHQVEAVTSSQYHLHSWHRITNTLYLQHTHTHTVMMYVELGFETNFYAVSQQERGVVAGPGCHDDTGTVDQPYILVQLNLLQRPRDKEAGSEAGREGGRSERERVEGRRVPLTL